MEIYQPLIRETPSRVTDIYISLLMTPCDYPACFGGTGPISDLCHRNGLCLNAFSNLLGRFLNEPLLSKFYICGSQTFRSHAVLFFQDLRAAFAEKNEVEDISPHAFFLKGTNKMVVLRYEPIVSSHCVSVRLRGTFRTRYSHFNRAQLAAFVHCGNTEDGPIRSYQCEYHDICVKTLGGFDSDSEDDEGLCRTCCWANYRGRMYNAPRMLLGTRDFLDEGCVAEPLGIPATIWTSHFREKY